MYKSINLLVFRIVFYNSDKMYIYLLKFTTIIELETELTHNFLIS